MRSLDIFSLFVIASISLAASASLAKEEGNEKRSAAATAAGLAVATLVVNSLASFFKNINGANNVKDTVVYGRSIRIHIPPDNSNCAVVTDLDSGYKSQKCGASPTEATSQATEELFTLLIQLGFVDQDSLHHKPELATRPPATCRDLLPNCDKRVKMGHCDVKSSFFSYTHHNCFRTCGGCQSLENIMDALQNQANQSVGY